MVKYGQQISHPQFQAGSGQKYLGKKKNFQKFQKAKPVFEVLPGWKCDIRGIKEYDKLPENCRKYIEFIEERIGYPITMISNGPGREDIIMR